MPDKTYDYNFRVTHSGGSLADLTLDALPDGKVRIHSSDDVYDITVPRSELKFRLQELEDKLKEDAQFGNY